MISAMIQAISLRSLTADALVQYRATECGICGVGLAWNGTGTGFPPSTSICVPVAVLSKARSVAAHLLRLRVRIPPNICRL